MTDDIPPFDSETVDVPPSNEESVDRCEVCGVALEYAGRGRHPTRCAEHPKGGRSTTPTRASSSTVEAAVQSLHGFYTLLAMPLTIFAPATAIEWSNKIDQLDAHNRQILTANPKLAKQIASTASGTGAPALIAVNVAYIGPTMLSAYRETMYRRAERMRESSDDV